MSENISQLNRGLRVAGRQVNMHVDHALADIDEVMRELTRTKAALESIQADGLTASQVPTLVGGEPADVDVRKVAEISRRVSLINELRHFVAMSLDEE